MNINWKKLARWVSVLGALFIVSAVGGGYAYLRSTVPAYNNEFKQVESILAEVEIIRDSFGMPHIYASSDEDAAFALGYATAQDRLFQMDMIRRSIRGRLSEILGEKTVKVDRLFRTITSPRSIDSLYALLSPEVKSTLQAYASGVNAFIENQDKNLPWEFGLLGYAPELWLPADCLAGQFFMAWGLNFSFDNELLRAAIMAKVGPEMAEELFIDYPESGPTITSVDEAIYGERGVQRLLCRSDPPRRTGAPRNDTAQPEYTVMLQYGGSINQLLEAAYAARDLLGMPFRGASNNWVVSGAKSTSGKPLLANDMHLGLILPCIWYEAHIVTPDQNVSGIVLPGMPFIVAGANESAAWGFTNVMADDADFYFERINPADSTEYEFKGQWQKMTFRHDTIKMRGGEDIPLDIRSTHHGPLIDGIIPYDSMPLTGIAMRWTIFDFHDEAQSLYRLNRARTIDDIETAARLFKCPGLNWVYADTVGNIGFWLAAGIPVRHDFDGASLLSGWDGLHEWDGYITDDSLPHLRNPACGWIATANNKPVGDDYPYPIGHTYCPPERIDRIVELLGERGKLSVDDFTKIQADNQIGMARLWVPIILSAVDTAALEDIQRRALAKLNAWDFDGGQEKAEPAIFHLFLQEVIASMFKSRLGDSLYTYFIGEDLYSVLKGVDHLAELPNTKWFDNPVTTEIEKRDDLVRKAYALAIDSLREIFGDKLEDWRWGDLHSLTIYHPIGRQIPLLGRWMNAGPYPMGGGSTSINVSHYRLTHPFDVIAGASQRHIFDLTNIDNSSRIIPGGISGNFMSPHYADQVGLWHAGQYRPFVLSRQAVEADAVSVTRLTPRPRY